MVIGGGFYGCCLALALRERGGRVVILEAGGDLLTQASYINQARVHHGYHYPRSLLTALRSSRNFGPFVAEFAECIEDAFEKVYAVARHGSRTSAGQFEQLCRRIQAPFEPAPERLRKLFEPALVEEVFLVTESAFDAAKLRRLLRRRLDDAGVEVRLGVRVSRVRPGPAVELEDGVALAAGEVFSCVYAETNALLRASDLPLLPLKHEITELALIRVPAGLASVGITIVDGPFLSTMPFPARGLHSLSHVRYTPREAWHDLSQYHDPGARLEPWRMTSNHPYMLHDARRYVPALAGASYVESMYTVKTLLSTNETDDGRPILFRRDHGIDGFSVILGSKIDNIYDVLQAVAA